MCDTLNKLVMRHFPCGSVDWNYDLFDLVFLEFRSLPLRKCGLKLFQLRLLYLHLSSLPLRKCGLKHVEHCETWVWVIRHFPCGSVDWNAKIGGKKLKKYSHFPCGSVDWNLKMGTKIPPAISHFPCGSVDWNPLFFQQCRNRNRHFPCGSVDWNFYRGSVK